MDVVILEKLLTIFGLLVIIGFGLRWAMRPVVNFSITSVEFKEDDGSRVIIRISNPKNYIPLRNGRNRFWIIVRGSQVIFLRSATGVEFEKLNIDPKVTFFGLGDIVIKNKKAVKPNIHSLDSKFSFANWRVEPIRH